MCTPKYSTGPCCKFCGFYLYPFPCLPEASLCYTLRSVQGCPSDNSLLIPDLGSVALSWIIPNVQYMKKSLSGRDFLKQSIFPAHAHTQGKRPYREYFGKNQSPQYRGWKIRTAVPSFWVPKRTFLGGILYREFPYRDGKFPIGKYFDYFWKNPYREFLYREENSL